MKPQVIVLTYVICICKVNISNMYEGNGSINSMNFDAIFKQSLQHKLVNVNAHP